MRPIFSGKPPTLWWDLIVTEGPPEKDVIESVSFSEGPPEKDTLSITSGIVSRVEVEEYVDGREIHAALLGNDPPEVLPLFEMEFDDSEFNPEGELLMTLGQRGVAGDGPDTFAKPSDLVIGGWIATGVAAVWIGGKVAREVAYGVMRFRNRRWARPGFRVCYGGCWQLIQRFGPVLLKWLMHWPRTARLCLDPTSPFSCGDRARSMWHALM